MARITEKLSARFPHEGKESGNQFPHSKIRKRCSALVRRECGTVVARGLVVCSTYSSRNQCSGLAYGVRRFIAAFIAIAFADGTDRGGDPGPLGWAVLADPPLGRLIKN